MSKDKNTQVRRSAGIDYTVRRKRVKKLYMNIHRDGGVFVSIPMRTSWETADVFVASHVQWIIETQQRSALHESKKNQPLPDKSVILAHFTAMSDEVYPAFADVLNGQKPTVKVRDMTSRWGVCHLEKRQITFSTRLYNMPQAAQIYVVVHEYCHFLQPNHSPAFWAEVAKLLPDWKERRDLLK